MLLYKFEFGSAQREDRLRPCTVTSLLATLTEIYINGCQEFVGTLGNSSSGYGYQEIIGTLAESILQPPTKHRVF